MPQKPTGQPSAVGILTAHGAESSIGLLIGYGIALAHFPQSPEADSAQREVAPFDGQIRGHPESALKSEAGVAGVERRPVCRRADLRNKRHVARDRNIIPGKKNTAC